MNPLRRIHAGISTVAKDPVGRRAYAGRLKWLLRGSGGLHAHSLEYRAGLTGRWAIPAERSNGDEEVVLHCPHDCSAHAPMSHLYERRFVYHLNDTVASSASGATLMVGAQEPPFFIRESIVWPFESILSHGLEIPEVKQVAERRHEKTVIFPTTPNYYHWLIEDVPAVIRAIRSEPDAQLIAFRPGVTDRHKMVAAMLGKTVTPTELVVALDNHILPGRASDSWFVHPRDVQLLEELGRQITLDDPGSGAERVYISRRNTARPLPNEEHIETLLSEHGFAILHLEDMPWREQIKVFQHARLIVAPHGAGLANLAFASSGATVVEVTFGLHYNRCYEWLCHVKNHRYIKIDGDAGQVSVDRAILAEI